MKTEGKKWVKQKIQQEITLGRIDEGWQILIFWTRSEVSGYKKS